jgi:hypothetical protein
MEGGVPSKAKTQWGPHTTEESMLSLIDHAEKNCISRVPGTTVDDMYLDDLTPRCVARATYACALLKVEQGWLSLFVREVRPSPMLCCWRQYISHSPTHVSAGNRVERSASLGRRESRGRPRKKAASERGRTRLHTRVSRPC